MKILPCIIPLEEEFRHRISWNKSLTKKVDVHIFRTKSELNRIFKPRFKYKKFKKEWRKTIQ